MKHSILLLFPALLMAGTTRAQLAAWHGDLTTLLGRIPIPNSSSTCYASATKTTDPNNGAVSIKDNGPDFNALQNQLTGIAASAIGGTAPVSNTAPTPEEIEQMKQQALQRAAAAQSMTAAPATAPSGSEVTLMRLVGPAQSAASRLNQLSTELTQKMLKLSKDSVQAVKQGPNCPEVQQGGYAGPTCACLSAHAIAYYTARVAKMDQYVTQVADLVRYYLPKINAEAAIIDDMEAKTKYGAAISNPAFRQMTASIQHQALAGVANLLAVSGGAWHDGATEYANEINAKSGASTGCRGK